MDNKALNTLRWIIAPLAAIILGTIIGVILAMIPRLIFNDFIGNVVASVLIATSTILTYSYIVPSNKHKSSVIFSYVMSIAIILFIGFAGAVALIQSRLDADFWQFVVYCIVTIIALIVSSKTTED